LVVTLSLLVVLARGVFISPATGIVASTTASVLPPLASSEPLGLQR